MRILVTNDDGIDSIGLHTLARALTPLGEVVIAAPDTEYSGAGASLGALHLIKPEIHRVHLDGVPEVWTVTGPPALCVMFARLGAFGPPFDLVVSGINPGANVGRAVYHSGTIGAALTGRNGGVSGIAVSQAVAEGGIEGQAGDEMLANQRWDSAAEVARLAADRLLADLPAEPVVLNINVPNLPFAELKGWRRTQIAATPIRAMESIQLEPKLGHEGAYWVKMGWGQPNELPGDSDGGAVAEGYVSVTWLSRILPTDPPPVGEKVEAALGDRFGGSGPSY
jgi:5'-nucleotidase